MIEGFNVEVPGNIMYWKYFEIKKFSRLFGEGKILPQGRMKKQWLSFLDKCGTAEKIPDNVDDIIQEAFKIME